VDVVRVFRSRKRWVTGIAGVVVVGASTAVAVGSPALGFVPTNLATGTFVDEVKQNSDRVKLQTKGPTDVASSGS
jgi:hypothetical protein